MAPCRFENEWMTTKKSSLKNELFVKMEYYYQWLSSNPTFSFDFHKNLGSKEVLASIEKYWLLTSKIGHDFDLEEESI